MTLASGFQVPMETRNPALLPFPSLRSPRLLMIIHLQLNLTFLSQYYFILTPTLHLKNSFSSGIEAPLPKSLLIFAEKPALMLPWLLFVCKRAVHVLNHKDVDNTVVEKSTSVRHPSYNMGQIDNKAVTLNKRKNGDTLWTIDFSYICISSEIFPMGSLEPSSHQ